MIYLFLAEGFEEIEAVSVIDILKRAGLKVTTVSIQNKNVTGAHGIKISADTTLNKVDISDASALILPGGMPGTLNLGECKDLCMQLCIHAEKGKLIAAICAAPSVFGKLGLLYGRDYTCYPGFESDDFKGNYKKDKCVCDTKGDFPLITAAGPGVANEFAFLIADLLTGSDNISSKLKKDMQI